MNNIINNLKINNQFITPQELTALNLVYVYIDLLFKYKDKDNLDKLGFTKICQELYNTKSDTYDIYINNQQDLIYIKTKIATNAYLLGNYKLDKNTTIDVLKDEFIIYDEKDFVIKSDYNTAIEFFEKSKLSSVNCLKLIEDDLDFEF